MSIILQLFFNGLIAGSIYALVAAGFSLIYSTNKFVHFAHGSAIAFSAYVLYWLFSVLGLDFTLGIADGVIVLDNGKVIADDSSKKIKKNKKVLEAYLGE